MGIAEKEQVEERGEELGSPMARSGVQGWEFVMLAWHAIFLRSCRTKALSPPYATLHSVSNYLPLIGFNERFNNTALPDQIKLLLSTMLNPGSLLCNASMSRDPPFCKTPPASLLPPSSHILSLLPHPPVCFSHHLPCLTQNRLRNPLSKNCNNIFGNVLAGLVESREGCP